jgi:hypothetical protein
VGSTAQGAREADKRKAACGCASGARRGDADAAVLDAHREGAAFTGKQLLDYRNAEPPADEKEAIKRRKIMRKARSKKKRPALLASLEQRYLNHV